MQTVRVMSIIGCVLFFISLIFVVTFGETQDNDAALGWGMIGCLYGVALSIVGIVQTSNIKKKRK